MRPTTHWATCRTGSRVAAANRRTRQRTRRRCRQRLLRGCGFVRVDIVRHVARLELTGCFAANKRSITKKSRGVMCERGSNLTGRAPASRRSSPVPSSMTRAARDRGMSKSCRRAGRLCLRQRQRLSQWGRGAGEMSPGSRDRSTPIIRAAARSPLRAARWLARPGENDCSSRGICSGCCRPAHRAPRQPSERQAAIRVRAAATAGHVQRTPHATLRRPPRSQLRSCACWATRSSPGGDAEAVLVSQNLFGLHRPRTTVSGFGLHASRRGVKQHCVRGA